MNADVFEAVCAMGDAARTAQSQLAQANTEAKNQLLNAIADALDQHADDIAAANTPVSYTHLTLPTKLEV